MDLICALVPKSLTGVEGPSQFALFCLDRVFYYVFHSTLRSLYFPVQIFTLLPFYAVLHHLVQGQINETADDVWDDTAPPVAEPIPVPETKPIDISHPKMMPLKPAL